ncbi:putative secreted protein, partial [Operophtera brumata]
VAFPSKDQSSGPGRVEGYLPSLYSALLGSARTVQPLVLLEVTINMRFLLLTTALLAVAQARPGLIYTQPLSPLGIQYANVVSVVNPHHAVDDFYDNPAIAEGLARESWFTNKEMRVVEREAEKIPRESIYKIVKNAGFLDRH